jgi:hypothetical protein
MNTAEKVVAIAAGLYDMRRMLITIVGKEKFAQQVKDFKPLFDQVEKANKCNTLEAMHKLLKTESVGGNPTAITVICAVAVEIMEPSLPAMKLNAAYNWKHDPATRLIYLGHNWSGNGYWHQFALADDAARKVWCEVKDRDLSMIEPSTDAPQKVTANG